MKAYRSIREECCEANRVLPKTGLVDLTFGNVSVLDAAAGVFAIKPSGVAYEQLKPADMVLVDLDGKIVAGKLRPSSDAPTHRCLFRAFTGVRAIVHTHSRHAVAFAQAAREIPNLGTTHADYFDGPVPLTRAMTPAEIAKDYEWETGNVIAERFRDLNPLDVPAALVRHHGVFVWGFRRRKRWTRRWPWRQSRKWRYGHCNCSRRCRPFRRRCMRSILNGSTGPRRITGRRGSELRGKN